MAAMIVTASSYVERRAPTERVAEGQQRAKVDAIIDERFAGDLVRHRRRTLDTAADRIAQELRQARESWQPRASSACWSPSGERRRGGGRS
jgi:hypothetical protein